MNLFKHKKDNSVHPETDINDKKNQIPEFPQELWNVYEKSNQEEDKEIIAALGNYAKFFQADTTAEEKISQFHICWRVYLKMHLYLDPQDNARLQRFNLMFRLVSMAAKMYKRHIDEKDFCAITLATFKFGSSYPGYHTDAALIEKCCKKSDVQITLANYYEADRLIDQELPEVENALLKRYLNHTVQKLLSVYAEDYSVLSENCKKNFRGERIFDDEKEYSIQFKLMNLPKEENFILTNSFNDEEIKNFLIHYNLR